MRLSADDLLAHVANHAPLDPETTRAVSRAVISVIGRSLSRPARELLDEEVDPVLGRWLEIDTGRTLDDKLATYGLTEGRAAEAIASVCRALAVELSDEVLGWMRRELPEELAQLLVAPTTEGMRSTRRHPRHLAEAHPGERGVADTAPPRRQHETITASNPHAESKLSSTSGMTQEREHETLAEGHDPRSSGG